MRLKSALYICARVYKYQHTEHMFKLAEVTIGNKAYPIGYVRLVFEHILANCQIGERDSFTLY